MQPVSVPEDYLALKPIELCPYRQLVEALHYMRYGRRHTKPPKLRPGLTDVDARRVLRMLGPDTLGVDTEVEIIESIGFPDPEKKIAYELCIVQHFDTCDTCGCACYCMQDDESEPVDDADDIGVDPLKFALLEKVYNIGLGNRCGGYMTVVRSGPDLRPSPSSAYDVRDSFGQISYGVWNGYVRVVLRCRSDGRELDRFLVAVVVTDHDT